MEIMTMTRNFMNYIKQIDFKTFKSKQRLSVPDIREDDAVFAGVMIFDLFFEGSKFTSYTDYRGPPEFEGIKPKNFGHWHYIFDKCMTDMSAKPVGTSEAPGERSSYLEKWWDSLKKVMRLHK
jgi:hypothetical protein